MRTITIVSPSGMFLTIGKELADSLSLRHMDKIESEELYLKILFVNAQILLQEINTCIEVEKIIEENSEWEAS